MPANLKYLIKKISEDIRYLYFLIEKKSYSRENEYFEFRNEIDERLNRINENSELLHDIANDIDWDNKTNRKFQKFNALLLITPTIIGLMLIILGTIKISANREVVNKLKQEISSKDSAIIKLTKVVTDLPDTTKSKIQLADSIKKLNLVISDFWKSSLNTSYFRYEFTGKPDTINLKALNVDLVILNNTTTKHLLMSVIKPKNISVEDFLFTSLDKSNSFSGPDGQMAVGQFVIISVPKLKKIKQDLTIQFDVPSLNDIPPFQQLTFKSR